MAERPIRDEVRDANAQMAQSPAQTPSVAIAGVGSPASRNPGVEQSIAGIQSAFAGIQSTLSQIQETQNVRSMHEGQMAMITGATAPDPETEKFKSRGYESTKTSVDAATWAIDMQSQIGRGAEQMSPDAFGEHVKAQIRERTKDVKDPVVLENATKAWTQAMVPVLVKQRQAYDLYSRQRDINGMTEELIYGSKIAPDAVAKDENGIPVSETVVAPVYKSDGEQSAKDRDIGIRTMIGEAGGMGAEGMMGVALVLKNRALAAGRFGGNTIEAVALAPKQFSAWNKIGEGGNDLVRVSSDSPLYKKAAAVYDKVMAGQVPDITGGSTHFYDARIMKEPPSWWDDEKARAGGGEVMIGDHRFAGRKNDGPISDRTVGEHLKIVDGKTPDIKGVDTRLTDIIQTAAANFPGYEVKFKSGKRDGNPNSAHFTGNALDVTIYKDGKELKDYQDPTTFRVYEQFAQVAKAVQEKKYGDLNHIRWGGYFSGGKDKYGALDLMHFDLDPNKLGMGGGDWDNGLTAAQRQLWAGVESIGRKNIAPIALNRDGAQQSTLRHSVMSSSMPDSDKATAVADAMRRTLQDGRTDVFASLGGFPTLYALGAKPSEIDEVRKAHETNKKKETAESYIAKEKQLVKLQDFLKTGGDKDTAFQMLTDSFKDPGDIDFVKRGSAMILGDVDDSDNRLINQPEHAAGIYSHIQAAQNGAEPVQVAQNLKDYLKSIGVKDVDKVAAGAVQQINSAYGGYLNQQKEALKQAEKYGYEAQKVKGDIAEAVATGRGGANIKGTVHLPGPDGSVHPVDAKRLFIDTLHKKFNTEYDALIEEKRKGGATDAQLAQTEAGRVDYVFGKELKALYAHDVIDPELSAQWTSMFRNPLTNKKGEINPEAAQVMMLLARAHADGVPSEYIVKMLGGQDDPKAGTLWEYVKENYDGTTRIEDILLDAETAWSNKDVQPLTASQVSANMPSMDAILQKFGTSDRDSFWSWNRINRDPDLKTTLHDLITKRANQLHKLAPGMDLGTIMTRAAADVANSSVVFETEPVAFTVRGKQYPGIVDLSGTAFADMQTRKFIGTVQPVQNIVTGNPLLNGARLDKVLSEPLTLKNGERNLTVAGIQKQEIGSAISQHMKVLDKNGTLFTVKENGVLRKVSPDEMHTNSIGGQKLNGNAGWAPSTNFFPKIEYDARTSLFRLTLYHDKELTQRTAFEPSLFHANDLKMSWAQKTKEGDLVTQAAKSATSHWTDAVDASTKGLRELEGWLTGHF